MLQTIHQMHTEQTSPSHITGTKCSLFFIMSAWIGHVPIDAADNRGLGDSIMNRLQDFYCNWATVSKTLPNRIILMFSKMGIFHNM